MKKLVSGLLGAQFALYALIFVVIFAAALGTRLSEARYGRITREKAGERE